MAVTHNFKTSGEDSLKASDVKAIYENIIASRIARGMKASSTTLPDASIFNRVTDEVLQKVTDEASLSGASLNYRYQFPNYKSGENYAHGNLIYADWYNQIETVSKDFNLGAQCNAACTGYCVTACTSTCQTSCSSTCQTSCSGTCVTSSCSGSCSSGSCSSKCDTDCSNTCGGVCSGTCHGGCDGSCTSCTSCSGGCEGCSGCSGSCSGCSGCGSGCSSTCSTLCGDDCRRIA